MRKLFVSTAAAALLFGSLIAAGSAVAPSHASHVAALRTPLVH